MVVALAVVQTKEASRDVVTAQAGSRFTSLARKLVLRRQELSGQTCLPLVPCKALQRVRALITAPSCSVRKSWIVFEDVRVGVDGLTKVAVVAEDVAFSADQAVGG
jgi:hypothetical protein